MKTHELKIFSNYFFDVKEGKKTFEVRKDDRNFQVGDFLLLRVYNPTTSMVGRGELKVKIIYILSGGKFGIERGFCVLGIALI